MSALALPALPHGATARRPTWADLPAPVRAAVAARLGGPVVRAASQGSGYTPGFASRLRTAAGRSAFVKAVDGSAHPDIAGNYRREAEVVARLPAGAHTPPLRWHAEADGWVLLAFADVAGRPPHRPWRPAELDAVLAALAAVGRALDPVPAGLPVPAAVVDGVADDVARWHRLAADSRLGAVPATRVGELAQLTARGATALAGTALVHADLRDDNLLVGADGVVWVCDWGFAARGPVWYDVAGLLVGVHGDGLDADRAAAAHPLTGGLDPADLDAFLAGLLGYFVEAGQRPELPGSPYLRAHQRWYAAATLSWLAARRGW